MTEQQQKSSVSSNNKFFVLLTTLFVTLLVWAWHAKVDITTVANGMVIPEKNITKLGTMVTGEIVKVYYIRTLCCFNNWCNHSIYKTWVDFKQRRPKSMQEIHN